MTMERPADQPLITMLEQIVDQPRIFMVDLDPTQPCEQHRMMSKDDPHHA